MIKTIHSRYRILIFKTFFEASIDTAVTTSTIPLFTTHYQLVNDKYQLLYHKALYGSEKRHPLSVQIRRKDNLTPPLVDTITHLVSDIKLKYIPLEKSRKEKIASSKSRANTNCRDFCDNVRSSNLVI